MPMAALSSAPCLSIRGLYRNSGDGRGLLFESRTHTLKRSNKCVSVSLVRDSSVANIWSRSTVQRLPSNRRDLICRMDHLFPSHHSAHYFMSQQKNVFSYSKQRGASSVVGTALTFSHRWHLLDKEVPFQAFRLLFKYFSIDHSWPTGNVLSTRCSPNFYYY